ncbi:MAG: hypothetical protein ACJ72X_15565, partial [Nitrososphaeraceae archaeon]
YYTTLLTIENAVNYYWKLKAIDSFEISNNLTSEEREKVIDNLIDNHEIKTVLVSNYKSESPQSLLMQNNSNKHTK